jgi:hypothetical protein
MLEAVEEAGMKKNPVWLMCVALSLLWTPKPASAQTPGQLTPCGIATIGDPRFTAQGLIPVVGGLVFDSNQGLCWLADSNLAGSPEARAAIGPFLSPTNPDPDSDGATLPVIYPDGTMDYETALNWVDGLNKYNGGKGWLNHNNWQLPTTQLTDANVPPGTQNSCSSQKQGNFGALCKGSALGNLYNVGLARVYPDSVVPRVIDYVWPFINLQPGLYWTSTSQSDEGYSTFSFNTGDSGANTTDFNFLHVLPMTHDVIGTVAFGQAGAVLLPYISGPGAGKAVYDTTTGLSWPINANLAAYNNFGFTATTVLDTTAKDPNVNHTSFPMVVPMIDKDGAMHFSAVCNLSAATDADRCPPPASGWIVSMNSHAFAGSSHWTLPNIDDLHALYANMVSQHLIQNGEPRLETWSFVGPFWRLQPGFYWSCERDNLTSSQAPCNPELMPGQLCPTAPNCPPQAYSFNFDDGFEGTDHLKKHFYVMVYFPAATQP